MNALPRLSYSGGVDADGHLLEPPDLWQRHIEPAYRDRAMRIRKGERGEYLEIDGRPSKLIRDGMAEGVGAMDRVAGIVYERPKTGLSYVDNAPYGGMDPKERIGRLDHQCCPPGVAMKNRRVSSILVHCSVSMVPWRCW